MTRPQTLLYITVATAIILAILEFAAGLLIHNMLKNELPIFDGILVDNRNILRIKPHVNYLLSGHIQVRTNGDGYREDFDFQDKDLQIAFMGDSFCFGTTVNVEQRYSNIVAKNLVDLQYLAPGQAASLCYNNGFEPEHYEYFLQLHPDLKPRHLFINLYLGNDLDADVEETVLQRQTDGSIASLQLPWRFTHDGLFRITTDRYAWITWLKSHSNIGRIALYRLNHSTWRSLLQNPRAPLPNRPNTLAVELGNFGPLQERVFISLQHTQAMMAARGTAVHILVIPQNYLVGSDTNPHIDQDNLPHLHQILLQDGLRKAVMYQCHNRHLECHDLSQFLRADDYLPTDGHWSISGNAHVAAFIQHVLDHRNPVPIPHSDETRNDN